MSYGSMVELLEFFVVKNASFYYIFGSPTLLSLQKSIFYSLQHFTLVLGKEEIVLQFACEPSNIKETETNNENFTSPRISDH